MAPVFGTETSRLTPAPGLMIVLVRPPFDDCQRPGGISVIQAFTNARQAVGTAMRLVDGVKTRQWSAAQSGEQFFAPDLGGIMVERGQDAVDQPEPVPFTTAIDQVSSIPPLRYPGCLRRWPTRIQRCGDQRAQTVGGDCSRPEQRQVGRHPDRGLGQHRQRSEPAARVVVHNTQCHGIRTAGRFHHYVESTPASHPHGSVAPTVRAQQDVAFGRPAVDGTTLRNHCGPVRFEEVPDRHLPCPTADRKLAGPAHVPQMPMEVEPEPSVGARMRMVRGIRAVPQRQRDPLTGIRPGGSGADHLMHGTCSAATFCRFDVPVAGQRDGQPGAQKAVGGHAWQVPAQQVGCEVTEVVRDLRGDIDAVCVGQHGHIDVDIESRCGTGTAPVACTTPVGCGLDHGRRHGDLAHTQPEGQSRVDPIRGRRVHQHSPCANWAPNL